MSWEQEEDVTFDTPGLVSALQLEDTTSSIGISFENSTDIPGGFILATLQGVPLRPPLFPALDDIVEEYRLQKISLGRAAELAGLPYAQIVEELRRRGVQLQFGPQSVKEAEEELSKFRKWLKKKRESSSDSG